MPARLFQLLLLLAFLILPGCSKNEGPTRVAKDGQTPGADKKPANSPDDKLETLTIGGLKVYKFGNVYMSAQPSEEDFAKLREAGVATVINLRMPEENTKFDEAKVLAGMGVDPANYHNPGFNSASTLVDPIFLRVRHLLNSKSEEPVLVHCASGNRVGAVWMAHRILDDGVPYEQALEEAKTIGMKPEAFEARVKEYVESKPE